MVFANYFELFSGLVKFYTTSYSGDGAGSRKHLMLSPKDQQHSTVIESAAAAATYHGQSLQSIDLLVIAVVFVNLVLAKRFINRKLRAWLSTKKLGLRESDINRLDECTWRMAYYTFTSILLAHSCFIKHRGLDFFTKSVSEYTFDVDLDEYIITMIEIAFYLHATYALLFEDVWRKDSPMMLLHHVMAVACLVSLYTNGILRLGLVIVVLRDTVDILIEVAKVGMCLRIQHGQMVESVVRPTKVCFSLFAVGFTVNQLYYYPLYCIYHMLNLIAKYQLQSPGLTLLVTGLITFLMLDLMWFTLIVKLLYKMLFTTEVLQDEREYDPEHTELIKAKMAAASGSNQTQKIKSN